MMIADRDAVPISNRRLVALNDKGVSFKWKDYHLAGRERYGVITLDTYEFVRRFLMHVLPQGFHRSRYYGLPTCSSVARIRALLAVPPSRSTPSRPPPQSLKSRSARASLPMLHQPHAHYRDFLAGASASALPLSGEGPDRHLMMTISEPSPRKAVPLSARSSFLSSGHLNRVAMVSCVFFYKATDGDSGLLGGPIEFGRRNIFLLTW
jgi:hypothetical protein